jgi:DNA-binding LacI/PurR family transcriptional regulator
MADKEKIPKYRRVEKYLISMIAENNYPPDTLLPSEPALCRKFHISRNTIRQAIGNLINEGLIYNEHGKGTFVASSRRTANTPYFHQEIGIVMSNVDQLKQPFFGEYLRGIQEEIDLHKSSIHLIFTRESSKGEVNLSREQDVMGLILISHQIDDNYILSLQSQRIPFVWFPSYKINRKVPYIYLDKTQGMYLSVEHLVKLGHRHIGYIAGSLGQVKDYEEKLQGFLSAMKEFRVKVNKNWIQDGEYTQSGAEQAVKNIFSQKSLPTALIVANDVMAISVINTLNHLGKKTPQDVSIIGFDDIADASLMTPSLTTIHVPMIRMGREAARILFDMINGKESTLIYQVNVEPELKIRNSTSPPKNK